MDRAALDVVLAQGRTVEGWCPAGRWAEDGPLSPHYPLRETPSGDPDQRTRWNVRDADATLIITRGGLAGGTALTAEAADGLEAPLLIVDLADAPPPEVVRDWLQAHQVRDLNVAGPRESERPGIYEEARRWLEALLGDG